MKIEFSMYYEIFSFSLYFLLFVIYENFMQIMQCQKFVKLYIYMIEYLEDNFN